MVCRCLFAGILTIILSSTIGNAQIANNRPTTFLVVSDQNNEPTDQLSYARYLNASVGYLRAGAVQMLNIVPNLLSVAEQQICSRLGQGVQAIVSVAQTDAVRAVVRKIAQDSGIPVIQVENGSWVATEKTTSANVQLPPISDPQSFVKLIPASTVMLSSLVEFIKKNAFQKVVIIYDPDYYDIRVTNKIIERIQQQPIEFSLVPIASTVNLNTMTVARHLNDLAPMLANTGKTAIVLLMRMSSAEEYVLNQNSSNANQKWIILTKDEGPFTCDRCTTQTALWLRLASDELDFQKFNDQFLTDSLEYQADFNTWMRSTDKFVMMSACRLMSTLAARQKMIGGLQYTCPARARANVTSLMTSLLQYGTTYYARDLSALDTLYERAMVTVNEFKAQEQRRIQMIGNWSVSSGLQLQNASPATSNVGSTEVLRVAVVVNPPFVEKVSWGTNITYRGYAIDILKGLSKTLNINYELFEVKDPRADGAVNSEGEWSGAARELLVGNADMVIPMKQSLETQAYLDFTTPIYDNVGLTILMKRPNIQTPKASSSGTSAELNTFSSRWRSAVITRSYDYLCVMEPGVWICLFFMLLISLGLLFCYDRLNPYRMTPFEFTGYSMKAKASNLMGALLIQGEKAPKTFAARMVVAAWWFLLFCVLVAYAASLTVSLWNFYSLEPQSSADRYVSDLTCPIASLEDLSRQDKIKFSVTNGSDAQLYFKRRAELEDRFNNILKAMQMNESLTVLERAQLQLGEKESMWTVYINTWRNIRDSGMPNTTTDAIKRVQASPSATEGFAWIGDATTVRYAELTNCDLIQVGNEFNQVPFTIAVQQGSSLKLRLNEAIRRLQGQQYLEHLKEKWWNQNPNRVECTDATFQASSSSSGQSDAKSWSSGVRQVKIENVGGAVAISFITFMVSLLVLGLEWFCTKSRRSNASRGRSTHDLNAVPSAVNPVYANGNGSL